MFFKKQATCFETKFDFAKTVRKQTRGVQNWSETKDFAFGSGWREVGPTQMFFKK